MGTSTPWGTSDYSERIARGIVNYATPSHGGLHVSPSLLATMPESWRSERGYTAAGWFEEDCDWALVVLAFPDAFIGRPHWLEHALGCAQRWNADKLAAFTPSMHARYLAALSAARTAAQAIA